MLKYILGTPDQKLFVSYRTPDGVVVLKKEIPVNHNFDSRIKAQDALFAMHSSTKFKIENIEALIERPDLGIWDVETEPRLGRWNMAPWMEIVPGLCSASCHAYQVKVDFGFIYLQEHAGNCSKHGPISHSRWFVSCPTLEINNVEVSEGSVGRTLAMTNAVNAVANRLSSLESFVRGIRSY